MYMGGGVKASKKQTHEVKEKHHVHSYAYQTYVQTLELKNLIGLRWEKQT